MWHFFFLSFFYSPIKCGIGCLYSCITEPLFCFFWFACNAYSYQEIIFASDLAIVLLLLLSFFSKNWLRLIIMLPILIIFIKKSIWKHSVHVLSLSLFIFFTDWICTYISKSPSSGSYNDNAFLQRLLCPTKLYFFYMGTFFYPKNNHVSVLVVRHKVWEFFMPLLLIFLFGTTLVLG